MNQPDPVAEAERAAECSTGNDGEACVENVVGLPCGDGGPTDDTPAPVRLETGPPPSIRPKAGHQRRAKRGRLWLRAPVSPANELVRSVLLAVQVGEAYRRAHHRYGRGADYLRLVPAGEARRNLAAGINRAVELGLIRLELRPNPSKIRRFFALKCPQTHVKTAEKQGV